MAEITIAFDRDRDGWTSEYSFSQMNGGISLNNNYYTFFSGEIWRHNDVNVTRNNFYGLTEPTQIVFIFNDQPSTVKNFKTFNFEGTSGWEVDIATNTESGIVNSAQFVNKEGKKYAYIRGDPSQFGELDLKSTTVQGAGLFVDPSVLDGIGTFELSSVPSSLSIGDIIYRSTITGETGGTPELVGRVAGLDYVTNVITIGDKTGIEQNDDGTLRTFFTPTSDDLVMYVKNNSVEKSGLIGFFATITMTNDSATMAELFSTGSEVFISS